MQIKLSKKQWEYIGEKANWIKIASNDLYSNIIENCDIKIPDDIRKHVAVAKFDLYFGPYSSSFWREESGDKTQPDYSFTKSCKIISDWFNNLDLPKECDSEGYPIEGLEETDQDDETYTIDESEIKKKLFGKELANYIN